MFENSDLISYADDFYLVENEESDNENIQNHPSSPIIPQQPLFPINIEKKKHKVTIEGVDVFFPYEPYPSQIQYMKSIIKLLNDKIIYNFNGGLAALESPTGTGKTLSLLCASLAWMNEMRKRKKFLGKILYTTRTHSQISQVIKELKKTCYVPRTAILSSRDFTCLHQYFKKDKNGEQLNIICKTRKSVCNFYHGYIENYKENFQKNLCQENQIMDIEDICKYDKEKIICPFYHQIDKAQNNSDIVFMPYNYLFIKGIRKAMNIDLKNNIILIDEAHNLRKVCEDLKSAEISSDDFKEIIKNLNDVGKIIEKGENYYKKALDKAIYNIFNKYLLKMSKYCLNNEIAVIERIEKRFINTKITNESEEKNGKVFGYEEFLKLFISDLADINREENGLIEGYFPNRGERYNYINYNKYITKTNITNHLNNLCISEKIFELIHKTSSKIQILIGILETVKDFIFNKELFKSYKLFMFDENKGLPSKLRYLKLMCFNPEIAFKDIEENNPFSIIITSGHLKPFEILEKEFNIKFDTILENDHVIDENQCHFAIIKDTIYKGYRKELIFDHKSIKEDKEIILALGETIYNLCKINDKGTVIFFPSYFLLNKCQILWVQEGILSKLEKIKNEIIIDDPHKRFIANSLKNKTNKNYIFFSVCRGSSSEGIDFKDDDARMIICVGIPYSNLSEDKIIFKKEYLNQNRKTTFGKPPGNLWYESEAIINVNQALGRVIRHSKDYGAMICIDSRYEELFYKKSFSEWMIRNSRIVSLEKDDKYFDELKNFFICCKNNPLLKNDNNQNEIKEEIPNQNLTINNINNINANNINYSNNIENINKIENLKEPSSLLVQFFNKKRRSPFQPDENNCNFINKKDINDSLSLIQSDIKNKNNVNEGLRKKILQPEFNHNEYKNLQTNPNYALKKNIDECPICYIKSTDSEF